MQQHAIENEAVARFHGVTDDVVLASVRLNVRELVPLRLIIAGGIHLSLRARRVEVQPEIRLPPAMRPANALQGAILVDRVERRPGRAQAVPSVHAIVGHVLMPWRRGIRCRRSKEDGFVKETHVRPPHQGSRKGCHRRVEDEPSILIDLVPAAVLIGESAAVFLVHIGPGILPWLTDRPFGAPAKQLDPFLVEHLPQAYHAVAPECGDLIV